MTKTEIAQIKRESRSLKSALATREKLAARIIKKHRDTIRQTEREITNIESQNNRFSKSTNDRLGILEGRLNS